MAGPFLTILARENGGTLKLELFHKGIHVLQYLFASHPRFGCFENIVLVVFKFHYAFSDIIHCSMILFL